MLYIFKKTVSQRQELHVIPSDDATVTDLDKNNK